MVVDADGAKKSLGQHWLHDVHALEAMAEACEAAPADHIIEIGPGHGSLTTRLLLKGACVTAIEYDDALASSLADTLKNTLQEDVLARLDVVSADIRTYRWDLVEGQYKVCANIPYYLTSNLMRALCETSRPPVCAALLMQKEVAERIAGVGGKMSVLSCVVQMRFGVVLGDVVPARLFTPPPKVDSRIITLRLRDKPLLDVDSNVFIRLVKAGFSEKRKTLRNSLRGGLQLSKEEIEALLKEAGIDPGRRAETLALKEWHSIYKVYHTT